MKKLLVVLMVWVVLMGGSTKTEAQTIHFYFLKGIIQAEKQIPVAQAAVKETEVALAKYKDKKPTMYYVTGAGVKKEAIDDELLQLLTAFEIATNKVKALEKTIIDKKGLWKRLYKLTDERKFKIVYDRTMKLYLKNEKIKQEREDETHDKILASGKYTLEEFADYWLKRIEAQVDAEIKRDAKIELEIRKRLEKQSRSSRNRAARGAAPRRRR